MRLRLAYALLAFMAVAACDSEPQPVPSFEAFVQEAQLGEAGITETTFGFSVSTSGTRALVGAPAERNGGMSTGAAYIFANSGGQWILEAKLLPDDLGSGAYFGASVALDGDRALVGAPQNILGEDRTGAAYVFSRNGGKWDLEARLDSGDKDDGDLYGQSVSLAGNRALIGSPSHNSTLGASVSGAAYVFVRSGSDWAFEEKLSGEEAGSLGSAVALTQDRALIGAPGSPNGGEAYVFSRSGNRWTQEALLTGPANFFGRAVSLSGSHALVGASDPGRAGSATLFVRSDELWTEEARFTSDVENDGAFFGSAVSVGGQRALVGSYLDSGTMNRSGVVHVFEKSQGQWSQQSLLRPNSPEEREGFGFSLAHSEGRLLVGALNGPMGAYVFSESLARPD